MSENSGGGVGDDSPMFMGGYETIYRNRAKGACGKKLDQPNKGFGEAGYGRFRVRDAKEVLGGENAYRCFLVVGTK
jgi:hypothetical protein